MYKIFLVNFGFFYHEEARTIDQAKALCEKIGFQSTVWRNKLLVAQWTTMSGWRQENDTDGSCWAFITPHPRPAFESTGRHEIFYHHSTQDWNMWDAIKRLDPFQPTYDPNFYR